MSNECDRTEGPQTHGSTERGENGGTFFWGTNTESTKGEKKTSRGKGVP